MPTIAQKATKNTMNLHKRLVPGIQRNISHNMTTKLHSNEMGIWFYLKAPSTYIQTKGQFNKLHDKFKTSNNRYIVLKSVNKSANNYLH